MAPDPPQLRKLAIVPAYNEQGMVGRVVREIRRHAPDFDVVVVDDGSTDETAADRHLVAGIAAEAAAADHVGFVACGPLLGQEIG